MTNVTSHPSLLVAVAGLLLAAGGCKATDPGPPQPETTTSGAVTMTLANTLDDMPEELVAWVVAVRNRAE